MSDFINNLAFAGTLISMVVALSSATGYIFSRSLKKKGYVLEKGTIINNKDKIIKSNYLQFVDQYTPEVKSNFMNNHVLQDFSTNMGNLESIPSGRVKKLFLSGRGSWRVTIGNILTRTGFDNLAEKEYSQML